MVSTEYLVYFMCGRSINQEQLALDLTKMSKYNTLNTEYGNTIMRKSTRSILQELSDIGLSRDTDLVIENRGANLIQSAVNLINLIRENYDVETAAELERRFINSIKANDPSKFKRGIKRIQEGKGS